MKSSVTKEKCKWFPEAEEDFSLRQRVNSSCERRGRLSEYQSLPVSTHDPSSVGRTDKGGS